eukprot:3873032-Lingulodinium_polyedra.AAC.1
MACRPGISSPPAGLPSAAARGSCLTLQSRKPWRTLRAAATSSSLACSSASALRKASLAAIVCFS